MHASRPNARLLILVAVATFAACWGILFVTHAEPGGFVPAGSTQSAGAPHVSARTPGTSGGNGPQRTIAFVAEVSPDPALPGSASEMTWKGIQQAAGPLAFTATRAAPRSEIELGQAIENAAKSADVVVTVGQSSAAATAAAAGAHPSTSFVAVDEVLQPLPNVRSVLFDETEIGYLGGFIAGSLSPGGKPGFVGGDRARGPSANYEAGFRQGLAMTARTGLVEWAGTDDHTEAGRTAFGRLLAANVDEIVLPDSLAGLGALRDACTRHIPVVGLGVDFAVRYPAYGSCIVTSVVKRFDVAIAAALGDVAAGKPLAGTVVSDVASGGVTVAAFGVPVPEDFTARLAGVVAALQANPPRSTASATP